VRRVLALRKLRLAALRRLKRVEQSVLPLSRDYRMRKMTVAYCIIEIVGLLNSFVRALYVSSVLGATHASGQITSCSQFFSAPIDALRFAVIWRFKRTGRSGSPPPYNRTNEPAWHWLNNIAALAHDISLSNESTILSALSRGGSSLDHFILVRNFFAHRNEDTLAAANQTLYAYAITPKDSLEESVCSPVPGFNVTLLELWLGDLTDTIDLMAR
jgi:hypothetical protein